MNTAWLLIILGLVVAVAVHWLVGLILLIVGVAMLVG